MVLFAIACSILFDECMHAPNSSRIMFNSNPISAECETNIAGKALMIVHVSVHGSRRITLISA